MKSGRILAVLAVYALWLGTTDAGCPIDISLIPGECIPDHPQAHLFNTYNEPVCCYLSGLPFWSPPGLNLPVAGALALPEMANYQDEVVACYSLWLCDENPSLLGCQPDQELFVDCDPASTRPGAIANLEITRDALSGMLSLTWDDDCGNGSQYVVYRGVIHLGINSAFPDQESCDGVASGVMVQPEAGVSEFFLVVPNDGVVEGSYGPGRVSPPTACFGQAAISGCAP